MGIVVYDLKHIEIGRDDKSLVIAGLVGFTAQSADNVIGFVIV